MTPCKLFTASALLLALTVTLAPDLAEARAYHHHHVYRLPYDISYLHNYGPGALPGSFAYYDGPTNVLCDQGAAAYTGQDHRRHPCF